MMRRLVSAFFSRSPAPDPDGFGQSLADDLRSLARFRRCRRLPVEWRRPSPDDSERWDSHPIVGRLGDATYAVQEVDGRRWVVRDRMWFGWPDPPEFAWFVLDGQEIWAALDFNDWPPRWERPPGFPPSD